MVSFNDAILPKLSSAILISLVVVVAISANSWTVEAAGVAVEDEGLQQDIPIGAADQDFDTHRQIKENMEPEEWKWTKVMETSGNNGEGEQNQPANQRRKRQLRIESACYTDNDCMPGRECCVPSFGDVHECRPLQRAQGMCHPGSWAAPFVGSRNFPLCPCEPGLYCHPNDFRCVRHGNLKRFAYRLNYHD